MFVRSIALAAIVMVAAPTVAEAKGCIRGAVVGGVAGHYAGQHGLIGAAGGCIAARHYYKNKAKMAQQQGAKRPQPK